VSPSVLASFPNGFLAPFPGMSRMGTGTTSFPLVSDPLHLLSGELCRLARRRAAPCASRWRRQLNRPAGGCDHTSIHPGAILGTRPWARACRVR